MSPVSDFLERYILEHCAGAERTLIVGSRLYDRSIDRRPLYGESIGVDIEMGRGVDLVHDMEYPLSKRVGLFDHVHCCSLLEHVQRPWMVAGNIVRAMRYGGTLIIAVPFVWRVHNYPGDYWRFTIDAVKLLFPAIEWVEITYVADNTKCARAPTENQGDIRWLQRTEVYGFGTKV